MLDNLSAEKATVSPKKIELFGMDMDKSESKKPKVYDESPIAIKIKRAEFTRLVSHLTNINTIKAKNVKMQLFTDGQKKYLQISCYTDQMHNQTAFKFEIVLSGSYTEPEFSELMVS